MNTFSGIRAGSAIGLRLGVVMIFVSSGIVAAQDSTWIHPVGGLWSSPMNWSAGVPNGPGHTARFATQPSGESLLVDIPVTLGEIVYERPTGLTFLSDEVLTFDALGDRPAWISLPEGAGTLTVDAPVTGGIDDHLEINVARGATVDLRRSMAPASFDLIKVGDGRLLLRGNNVNWTGELDLREGVTEVHFGTALGAGAGETVIGPDGRLVVVGPLRLENETFRLNGGTLQADTPGTVILGGLLNVTADSSLMVPQAPGQLRLTGELQGSGDLSLDQGRFDFAGQSQHDGTIHVRGATLTVNSPLQSLLQVDSGLAEIRAASGSSGDIRVTGGTVHLRYGSGIAYGGEIFLYGGELQSSQTSDITIRGITAEAGEHSIFVPAGRTLNVTGGVEGPGTLTLENQGTVSFNTVPLRQVEDLVINGRGAVNVSVPLEIGGRTRLNSGTLRIRSTGASTIEQKPGTTLFIDNSAGPYTGSIVAEGPAQIATLIGGTIAAPISISSGTLELHSANRTLNVTGPVTGDGSLTIRTSTTDSIFDAQGPIQVAGSLVLVSDHNSGVVELNDVVVGGDLMISSTTATFNGPLNVAGDMSLRGSRTARLSGADNVVDGHVEVRDYSGLTIDGDTIIGSLSVSGTGGGWSGVGGSGNLHVRGTVELQRAGVQFTGGSLVGSPNVIKTTPETARVDSLGSLFTGDVRVQEGVLELFGAGALGSGSASIDGPSAAIRIAGDAPVAGRIYLNNHHGDRGRGALRMEENAEFAGDLHLGPEGATIAGWSMLVLSGSIHGGNLTLKREPFGNPLLWIRANQHTYTGSTIIDGATLMLSHAGTLQSTSEIVLGPTSSLELTNHLEWGSSGDRVGDKVPITMRGGRIVMESHDSTGETLGPLAVEPGAARLLLDGRQSRFSVASLQIEPFASLEIRSPRLGGAGERDIRLMVRDAAASSFLGGQISVIEAAETASFLKYDADLGMLALSAGDYALRNPSTWNSSSHALVTGKLQLPSDRTIESLTMRYAAVWPDPALDLQGHTLNVRSGGVIFPATAASVSDGRLTAGEFAADVPLQFHTYSSQALVDANISDNPGPDGQYDSRPGGLLDADNGRVHVIKSGEGRLLLAGNNTYSGETWINSGHVEVLTSQAIPSTTDLVINGGGLDVMNNVVVSPASVAVRNGSIVEFGGALQSPSVVLERGFVSIPILGDGEIVKTTLETFEIGSIPNFDGNVRVEAGILRASGLGNGVTTVHSGARLETAGALQGNIELRGGTIAPSAHAGIRIQSPRGDGNGWVRVAENSFIETEHYITFQSELTLDPETTLTRRGSGELVITSPATFGDQATLDLGHGRSQIGSESEPIYIGTAVTINVQSGDVFLMGALTTTHAESILSLDGAAMFDIQSSIDVRDGQRLTVTRDGTLLPLTIEGQDRFLRGEGRLRNPVSLGNGGLLSPGDGIGRLTIDGPMVIDPGARLRWEMRDAGAAAGESAGWDLLQVGEALQFGSTQQAAVTLEVVGMEDHGQPAAVANFDPTRSQEWLLITADSLENFDPGRVNLSTRGFDTSHPLPRGARFLLSSAEGEVRLRYQVVFGDFTRNGRVDARDIDVLSDQIRSGSTDLSLDVNYDHVLDEADRVYWVQQIKGTWFGDADLNGHFNSADLVAVLASGEYEDAIARNSSWADGDWNGDSEFTSADLVTALADGGFERGPRAAMQFVPEPSALAMRAFVALVLVNYRRKHRRRSSRAS